MNRTLYKINCKPFAIYSEDSIESLPAYLTKSLPYFQAGLQIRIYPYDTHSWDIIVSYDKLTNTELDAIRAGGPFEQTNLRTGEWETTKPESKDDE